jgi:hypothetical protein
MKNALVITSVIVIAVVGAGISLVIYAENMEPPKENMSVTIPDDTFPR